jgi:hypothetical protein
MTSEATMDDSDTTAFFDAAPGSLERIVGTRVFNDVLYSEAYVERATSDGLFPGERAYEIEQNVTTARSIGIDGPEQVLVPRGYMTLSGSYPFTAVVFVDQMVVRGRQLRHRRGPPMFEHNGYALEQLYRAAIDSEHYSVELVETDYEMGCVTVSVEEVI